MTSAKEPVMMFSATGGSPCPENIDGNGSVEFGDVLALLADWAPAAVVLKT